MKKFDIIFYSFSVFAFISTVVFIIQMFFRKHLSLVSRCCVFISAIGIFLLVDVYFIEPNWIAIEKVNIDHQRFAAKVQGLKVVHISDIHLRKKPGFLEKQLVSKINDLEPDLLFITGDFLDDLGSLRDTIDLLKSFKPKLGVYGVLGNTDHHFFRTRALITELRLSGIDILLNENRKIVLPNGQHIWLAGVDDPVTGRARLGQALGGIPQDEHIILLAHSPDIYTDAVLAKIDLLLVGHTHGGQVGIPFLIRHSEYANRSPFMAGMFQDGKTTMYVNRGIGTKTLPIRLFCRPEITLYKWN